MDKKLSPQRIGFLFYRELSNIQKIIMEQQGEKISKSQLTNMITKHIHWKDMRHDLVYYNWGGKHEE